MYQGNPNMTSANVPSGGGSGISYHGNSSVQKLGLESAHAEVHGSIQEVAKLLHSLEARLNPVLFPAQMASSDSCQTAPTPIRSSLHESAVSAKRAIDDLARHIESLINRVEI